MSNIHSRNTGLNYSNFSTEKKRDCTPQPTQRSNLLPLIKQGNVKEESAGELKYFHEEKSTTSQQSNAQKKIVNLPHTTAQVFKKSRASIHNNDSPYASKGGLPLINENCSQFSRYHNLPQNKTSNYSTLMSKGLIQNTKGRNQEETNNKYSEFNVDITFVDSRFSRDSSQFSRNLIVASDKKLSNTTEKANLSSLKAAYFKNLNNSKLTEKSRSNSRDNTPNKERSKLKDPIIMESYSSIQKAGDYINKIKNDSTLKLVDKQFIQERLDDSYQVARLRGDYNTNELYPKYALPNQKNTTNKGFKIKIKGK